MPAELDQRNRRRFLEGVGLGGLGLSAAMTAGCQRKEAGGSAPKLKAAFSNAGLQSTWCMLGKQTAELWGQLLGVEVHWFDGQMDGSKQRDRIDGIVHKDWDFCCFQAAQIDVLAEPTRKLKEKGIPIISMDTLLVDHGKLRETGVWIQIGPDQEFMGESSTRYLMKAIGGKGKVIHIGGNSAHSGAQGRKQGFERVLEEFPDVEVVGGGIRWCDWLKEKARDNFEALLEQSKEPIAGAFFHSDDMALACMPALKGTIHEKMIITAVDGQKEGLEAVRDGRLAATTVNPVCRIHKDALILGQFIARGKEEMDNVPLDVVSPGPLVSREAGNLDAMLYLADPSHCMV